MSDFWIGFRLIMYVIMIIGILVSISKMTNKELFYQDMKRVPLLIIGFTIMSIGIAANKESLLGLSSWNLFHDGLSNITGLSMGFLIQIVGLVVLGLSMYFFKTKIGIGTLLNIIIVGQFIDLAILYFPFTPNTIFQQSIILGSGIILMTFGRSLYISTTLGAGPRDGLFVGLSRVTKIDVKYVKPAIEITVLILGFLMGGIAGIGTIITIVVSGYLVQFFFQILGFDPKSEKQSDITVYYK